MAKEAKEKEISLEQLIEDYRNALRGSVGRNEEP